MRSGGEDPLTVGSKNGGRVERANRTGDIKREKIAATHLMRRYAPESVPRNSVSDDPIDLGPGREGSTRREEHFWSSGRKR